MKIIGWIGTILFAPFYFLYHAIDKLKMVYWLPAGAGAYGLYLGFLAIKSVAEDIIQDVLEGNWYSDFWANFFSIILVGGLLLFTLLILGYLIYLAWLILSSLNHFVYAVIFFVLTPFIYGFTYCNAWRQGMSRYELEGKIAYIEHEKELKKQALKEKKEAHREKKERRKQEQYTKGYQKQYNKSNGKQQDDGSNRQHSYNYENTYRQQQREQQREYAGYQSTDVEYRAALSLFMLEEGYTLDELKKQRNRLMKTFHPDEDDAEMTRYAQKINNAFSLLKTRILSI